ncbi:uncharacterized protein N7496_005219 [Penicillium cataractarum]|uniref:Uncharacterized protein n=1 Tax=Penicillium cataractarum TaxID=2100454 RepID=A0A9W9SG79_9EURO|nr:uncharacterized protein N7496_005219 [Penicillium cataractarum]KAJ5377810.1 hypothetical protein N7496_005219 [Penicillium cataractarum]
MHQREEDYHLLDPMTAQLLYERIEREFSTTGVSAGDNDDFLAYDWLGHLFDDAQFRSPATSFGIVPGGPCLQGLPAQPGE